MKIGFICVGNSARSQMAEGFAKEISQRSGKVLKCFQQGQSHRVMYTHWQLK